MRQKKRSARFRLAATYFLCAQKVGKDALRGADQAGEGRALMISPLRTPVFTGEQDKKCHRLFPALG